jgi:hypothetical protein
MGSPSGDRRRDQLATRERQAGPHGVAGIRGQNLKPLCSGVDYRNELTAIQIGRVCQTPHTFQHIIVVFQRTERRTIFSEVAPPSKPE